MNLPVNNMFCIHKSQIEELKKVIKSISDKNQIDALVKMTNEERISLFEKAITPDSAKKLNSELNRALVNKKGTALRNWLRKNLDEKYRTKLEKKFSSIDELEEYVEQRLQVWAEQKHGIALTPEEIKKFTKLGKNFYEVAIKLGDNVGDLINNKEANLEYARALGEMQKYHNELMPGSPWKTFTQTIGKATMLASIKTPLLNIESNTVNALSEAITRRISYGKVNSDVSGKLVSDYRKAIRDIFKETNVDFSRMISVDSPITGIGRAIGEDIAIPKNKHIKAYTDFIFTQTLMKPDVWFSSFASSDSMSLYATKIAKQFGKNADDVFLDAIKITPKTKEGEMVRAEAIASAMKATFTNDTWSSKFVEGFRQMLNKLPGRLGDIQMPFVKTVANIAEVSADYAGLGFIKAGTKGAKMLWMKTADKAEIASMVADMTRAGLGISTAYMIASWIDAEDFMGAYDPDRIKIDQLANSNYNAIKISTPMGEKWVSLDYFSVLALPLAGMLYAKKDNSGIKGYMYSGGIQYLAQLPLSDGIDTFKIVSELGQYSSDEKLKYFGDSLVNGTMEAMSARIVPGILNDLARATDDVQRDTKSGDYIVDVGLAKLNFNKFVAKIPYWRKDLPVKYDALGRVMYESTPIESLMFGARVRTARMDEITSEILRLRDSGYTPNIKDPRFMYSSKVEELKEKTGDKFYDISREYGETLARKLDREFKTATYKRLSDEEKQKRIYNIGQIEYERMLKSNGVQYR